MNPSVLSNVANAYDALHAAIKLDPDHEEQRAWPAKVLLEHALEQLSIAMSTWFNYEQEQLSQNRAEGATEEKEPPAS